MHYSLASSLLSALTLVSVVSANITGFSGPSYPIKEGDSFDVTFTTRDSLTNNDQYHAVFGMTTRENIGNTIGSQAFANVDLSHIDKSQRSFSVPITMGPVQGDETTRTLATAVFGQVGASGGITLQYFNTTINVVPS